MPRNSYKLPKKRRTGKPLFNELVAVYKEACPAKEIRAAVDAFWESRSGKDVPFDEVETLVERIQEKLMVQGEEADILKTQAFTVITYTLSVEMGANVTEA